MNPVRIALFVILTAILAEAVHAAFHIVDWLIWGWGLTLPGPIDAFRSTLLPWFANGTPLGTQTHAALATFSGVALFVAAIALAFVLWPRGEAAGRGVDPGERGPFDAAMNEMWTMLEEASDGKVRRVEGR